MTTALAVAAFVVLTALVLVDLVLSLGIIRRLRDHEQRLAAFPMLSSPGGLAVGQPVPEFSVMSTDGVELTRSWFDDATTVVAFVAPGCQGCDEQRSALDNYLAAAGAAGVQRVVAVSAFGGEDGSGEIVQGFEGTARVVVGGPGDGLEAAFAVTAFPSHFLVGPDLTVLATSGAVAALPAPEAAGAGHVV